MNRSISSHSRSDHRTMTNQFPIVNRSIIRHDCRLELRAPTECVMRINQKLPKIFNRIPWWIYSHFPRLTSCLWHETKVKTLRFLSMLSMAFALVSIANERQSLNLHENIIASCHHCMQLILIALPFASIIIHASLFPWLCTFTCIAYGTELLTHCSIRIESFGSNVDQFSLSLLNWPNVIGTRFRSTKQRKMSSIEN